MEIEAVVEIPAGSRNKYEVSHETGEIWLDRRLFTATSYPADYGFFPHTHAEDDDPLDCLILVEESMFPGCHVMVRPVCVFWMSDENGPDAKVICVPAEDPRYESYKDLDNVPQYLLDEIEHFFRIYKDLEPSKSSHTKGWEGYDAAVRAIEQSTLAFQMHETRAAKPD